MRGRTEGRSSSKNTSVNSKGRIQEGDQFGFYENPLRTAVPFWGQTSLISSGLPPKRDCGSKGVKEMDVDGKRTFNSQYIRNEEGRLLRDIGVIRER